MADEQENIKLQFDSNAKTVAGDVNKLGASIESTTQSTNENNQAVEQGEQAYKTFKTQLREANQELQKSIQLYGETSEQTIKAAKEVANLKDQIGFAKDLSDKFNPDQKMKALGAATQVAGTGLQGVTAGMALFGGESEDTQKQLLKVQAAMAFSDSISNFSNLGDQIKIFKTIVKDTFAKIVAAKAVEKSATDAGTASQIRQNLAVLANPYVIAAAALTALVVGIYAWTKANSEAEKKENQLKIAVQNNKRATDSLAESIENAKKQTSSSNDIEVLRARAYGATDKEIQKLIKSQKELAVSSGLSQTKETYNNLLKANQDYAKALKTGNKEIIDSAKENQQSAKDLYKSSNESYNDAIVDEIKFNLESQIELNQKSKDAQIKYNEEAKSRRQKNIDDAIQKAKEDADSLKKTIEEQAKNEADLKKNIADAIDVAQEKNNEFRISAQEKEIQDVNDKYFTLIENAKKFGLDTNELEEAQLNERNEINLKYQEIDTENKRKKAEEDIATDKAVVEAKIANQNLLVSQGEKLIQNIKSLAGKNKAIQKATIITEGGISVGKAIANTSEAVTKDLAKGAPFSAPLVALDLAVGATSVASIIQGTSKALQAVGGGGSISGTAPNISGGGGGISTPPSVAFNNTAENQIGRSVNKAQGENPPIKVVVAESDITKAQENVKVLVNKNTF
jgi:hypothetical protein